MKKQQETELNDLNQVVRGCQDYEPQLWSKIQFISNVLRDSASQLGISEIETPTMEYKSLLLDKYGDEAETKLIYELQNGKSALRYDLTVPFTRYVMNNGLYECKRLQIGRVYRRDLPVPGKGRFCEFYQGDVDIVGERELMVAEAEILKLIDMTMQKLRFSGYVIKINFRKNLETIFQKIGVKANAKYFKSLCVSIDKLDKYEWEYVEKELLDKKLTLDQCAQLKGLLDSNYLDDDVKLDYDLLGKYIKLWNIVGVEFDTKLARGLDYYTGLIYEVVFPGTEIGSVIAGGRYDKLIYRTKKKSRVYIPAIGVSFGISRLALFLKQNMIQPRFKVYVVSQDLDKKLEITDTLWKQGYQVEYLDKKRKNIKEINFGIKNNFNFIIIYGENGDGMVCVKRNDQSADKIVSMEKMIETIENFETI